jgi:hypothetical protein
MIIKGCEMIEKLHSVRHRLCLLVFLPALKFSPLLFLSALALYAQNASSTLDLVLQQIQMKDWKKAARELDRTEQNGRCKESVCLVLHARIAEGTGDRAQALDYARRAATLFDASSGLKADDYNHIGAILYRCGSNDPETLNLAEKAFRQADVLYQAVPRASNIRINLAITLEAMGRAKEARAIMDALKIGMLIDPGMAILGDFQAPGVVHF